MDLSYSTNIKLTNKGTKMSTPKGSSDNCTFQYLDFASVETVHFKT